MPLDSPSKQLWDASRAANAPKPYEQTPQEARASMSARQAENSRGPQMQHLQDAIVAGTNGDIALRIYESTPQPRAIIVYLHGGGWALGEPEGFDPLARRIAAATESAVVLVDYRLAPEYPFPAGLEDSWEAFQWSNEQLRALRPKLADLPIVIMGDSSGGNLAAVIALRAAQQGIRIAAQVLVYPVTDANLDSTSYLDENYQLILDRDSMSWFWDLYEPDKTRRLSPKLSPLRSRVPDGTAPCILLTAENDVLHDDGAAYATHLEKSGVKTVYRNFEGQLHGFLGMTQLPASLAALVWIAGRLEETLQN